MSLSNAMSASVSGINSASTAISVIGDNIANISTPGFKERRAIFADLLGQSISTAGGFAQTGSGSTVLDVTQIFGQGSLEASARSTDLAIDGRGFFVIESAQGRVYSRAGLFSFDKDGYFTEPTGSRVQGFGIDPTTLQPTGQLSDIQLNTAVAPPQVSSLAAFSLNLDSNAPVVGPFDPSNPVGTSNFQTVVTLYDSLGVGHPSTLYFTNAGAGSWEWNAGLPPADTTLPPATAGDPTVIQSGGTLSFDTSGNITAATGAPATFEFSGGSAAGQSIDIDFGQPGGAGTGLVTTQFAGQSTVNSFTQDGFGAGTLQGISFDRDGFVVASFSNGVTRPVAQVALATFPSVENLVSVGNNGFVESRESGQPLIGAPRSGQFGSVRASSIEQSNVDLAAQFIKLILNQRAFQANTRTVSTANELMANLVQLGQ